MTTLPPRLLLRDRMSRVAPLQCERKKPKRENGFQHEAHDCNWLPDANASIFPVTGAGNEARTRDPNLGKVVLYH